MRGGRSAGVGQGLSERVRLSPIRPPPSLQHSRQGARLADVPCRAVLPLLRRMPAFEGATKTEYSLVFSKIALIQQQ